MILKIARPILHNPEDGASAFPASSWVHRLLQTYFWHIGINTGNKMELSWNNVYKFWDVIIFSGPGAKVNFDELETKMKELDVEKCECKVFDYEYEIDKRHVSSMRFWLYPRPEYGEA